jgi:serum/glucocorticoid-regulated kinase 2
LFIEIIPNKTKQVCINDFQLLKVIGRGGFSKVFLVRKKDTGLLFAMKVMQKNSVASELKYRQVVSEKNIMASLDHPYVVKLHWAFQSVSIYIVKFCRAKNLIL